MQSDRDGLFRQCSCERRRHDRQRDHADVILVAICKPETAIWVRFRFFFWTKIGRLWASSSTAVPMVPLSTTNVSRQMLPTSCRCMRTVIITPPIQYVLLRYPRSLAQQEKWRSDASTGRTSGRNSLAQICAQMPFKNIWTMISTSMPPCG